jgi:hypothetical protein
MGEPPVRIARVFPRRTNATPRDPLSFYPTDREGLDYATAAPGMWPPEVDAVHVSVTFDWDLEAAQWLVEAWEHVAPVTIGGPHFDRKAKTTPPFAPGAYLKPGCVITSRGCPNAIRQPGAPKKCWFCLVQPGPVELPITEGWNVMDDNLLACSERHVLAVFDMLRRQKEQPQFTGGLEAALLTPALAEAMRSSRPKQFFFAFDTPDDWEPLVRAAEMCWKAGFTKASHALRCYVLCGWPKDTMDAADARMRQVLSLGILPMAMLYRDRHGRKNPAWQHFQNVWVRPHIVASKLAEVA